MLSEYTLKYINLLKEEVELYKWAEDNKPQDFDIEQVITEKLTQQKSYDYAIYLCAASIIREVLDYEEGWNRKNAFGRNLVSSTNFNYSEPIIEWCISTDEDKACLYLAKTVNRIIFQVFPDAEMRFFNDVDIEQSVGQDFDSLPLSEPFLKTSAFNSPTIEHSSLSDFIDFNNNYSFYSNNWENYSDKEDFLRWFFLTRGMGDVSIQVTENSYTQVPNPKLEDDTYITQNVNLDQDVVYFDGREAHKASHNGQDFRKNIEPLEAYALNIVNTSSYSILAMPIDTMLERLQTATQLNHTFTSPEGDVSQSISYKLIFDIDEQQSVIVPSVDMYQSLLYLKAMGNEEISMYYDAQEKRVVIRGKVIDVTTEQIIGVEGSRIKSKETTIVPVPTFAIIYEQKIEDLTGFMPVEYVQFFNPQLTFKEKYDMLHTKRKAPMELPEEFIKEYPTVSETYTQQVEVALSNKKINDKHDYVMLLVEEYLNTYTEVSKDESGDEIRKSIVGEHWTTPDYILKVQEAYWQYNTHISVDELLSFFVSKGNSANYRILCMKILGVDYHLFESSLTEHLLDTNKLFVSKLNIDVDNITAEVEYEGYNSFISGNIYNKQSYVDNNKEGGYGANINTFFGNAVGSSLYDAAVNTVGEAVSSRFTPSIVVDTRDAEEAKRLGLNIDIFCPIFFNIPFTGYESDTPIQYTNGLSTGKRHTDHPNHINIVAEIMGNSEESEYKEYGHFSLFQEWLKRSGAGLILGTQTVQEIIDGYIFPLKQGEFTYEYVFPLFQNHKQEVVGYTISGVATGSIKSTLAKADSVTRAELLALDKIANADTITKSELEQLEKDFVAKYSERFWAARKEGRRLFNYFLERVIEKDSREMVQDSWNRMFNNYATPKLSKVPIFPSFSYFFGKKDEARPFALKPVQTQGIRHLLSRKNSGLLLHEVGFGKTTTAVTAISSMLNTGDASRVMFFVPNSVYDKFERELKGTDDFYGLLPDVNFHLVDNMRESVLKAKKNGLKIFTKDELRVIGDFKTFSKDALTVIDKLKRKRVTFEDDPLYHALSSWDEAFRMIKKELEKKVKGYDAYDSLVGHIEHLDTIYKKEDETLKEDLAPIKSKIAEINRYPLDDDGKDALSGLEKTIAERTDKASKILRGQLKVYIDFIKHTLIDDLGYYKPSVMEKKTILIAKHEAMKVLRPSSTSIMRALMFREGEGEAETFLSSVDPKEWAAATGLKESDIKKALKILTRNPISFEKLNIDTVVIDEIHNFNNIVKSAGRMAWTHRGKTIKSHSGRRNNDNQVLYALEKAKQPSRERSEMKYDLRNQAANDRYGQKLNAMAVCLETQYRNKDSKNVILLSATPFTDTPFQVMSVLGMANKEMLSDNGIDSSWDFFNTFINETYKFDVRHDGRMGIFVDIEGYYNDKPLSNLITNVADVKITDEEIEKNRPKKALIPQNKKADGTENNVAETSPLGDWFDELQECNSRVLVNEKYQQPFLDEIDKYLLNSDDQRAISEIFPIHGNRTVGLAAQALDEEVKLLIDSQLNLAKDDMAEHALNNLLQAYKKGRFFQHELLEQAIEFIQKEYMGGVVKKPKDSKDTESEVASVAIDVAELGQAVRIKHKAISCQTAQQGLVISPYFVNLGSTKYTSKFLPPLDKTPAKTFVETSSKMMFVVGAIQQTIEYQEKQLAQGKIKKIGGQVIYFSRHNFFYGGKSYNAFELLADYIAENVKGISNAKTDSGEYVEIGIISSSTPIEDRVKKIDGEEVVVARGRKTQKDLLNDGSMKVLLGSKAIKEGIDLQENSTTMYILEAEFSPEVAMQVEGRIWRQGNPYFAVRIIYVLAINTVDSFIYSKVNQKVARIKMMLESGVYEMNTTQFLIDTKEMYLTLLNDPKQLAEISYADEKSEMTNNVAVLDRQSLLLEAVRDKYPMYEDELKEHLEVIDPIYNNMREAHDEAIKIRIEKDLMANVRRKREQDMTAAKFKGTVKEFNELPKNKGKYVVKPKEIQDEFDKKIEKNPDLNPFPKLDTKLSENTLYQTTQAVVVKIVNNLKRLALNFENQWRRMDEEEQKKVRSKKDKQKSELVYLAFYDATDVVDIASFTRSTNEFFSNAEITTVIEEYQSTITGANPPKKLSDIGTILEKIDNSRMKIGNILSDPIKHKTELEKAWSEELKKNKETTDSSIDGLVKSLKDSEKLIRLR